MSDAQNQGSGQPAPASAPPAPVPQPDFVDVFSNPAIIGTDKKSDTPTLNKAVQPQGNTETR